MVESSRKIAIGTRRRRWKLFVRVADFFRPASTRSDRGEAVLRARVTAITCLVGGFAVLAALFATTEESSVGVRWASYGLSTGFFLVPVAMRSGLAPAIAQQSLLGLMCLYASFLALMTGGKDTAAIFIATLVPFFSILFSGIRIGLLWSIVMSAAFVGISAALASGYHPPVVPDFEAVAAWNLWAAVIGIFATLGLASSYEWLRSDAERKLQRERRRADRLHAAQRAADQRFQTELRALVDERTRALELSHLELRRAERLASIGTLAAGVAHEINNPIGAILISAQYALASGDDAKRESIWRMALEESESQAMRCARIVKALLRFSAGSSAAKSQQDLNQIVRGAVAAMRGGLQRDDFERIELALSPERLELVADPIGIEQVVVNLVRNGLEASAAGAGVVRVTTARDSDGPCLCIEDDGPGIREGDLPRIFDPFFSTREQTGGTGLGLSIVHGIIRDHGGSIDVVSDRGRGTRFSVRFPSELAGQPFH